MAKIFNKKETMNTETGEYKVSEYITDSDESIVWKPHSTFVKVFPNELKRFRNKMTSTDLFIIMDLIPHISYKSGMLTKNGNNDARYPLLAKDIEKITGFGKKAVLNSLNHMVDIKLLYKGKIGRGNQYFVNPHVFFKGKRINDTLIAMFKDYNLSP